MDAQQFLAEFGHIANAPGGVARLRELVLQLAMQGKLVSQSAFDTPASTLLEKIEFERDRLVKAKKIKKPKPLPAIKKNSLPYQLPAGWEWTQFPNCYFVIGNKTNQIQTKEYLDKGRFPVVDQGIKFIVGYCDDPSKLLEIDTPVVVFGDHTKNLKYIDFDFVIGADGVKVLRPYESISAKFMYIAMQSFSLGDRGYARHFKLLNEKLIPLPPLEEQSRIVAKVDEMMALCDQLESQQQKRRALQNHLRQATLQAVAASQSPHELQDSWLSLQANFDQLFSAPEDVSDLRKLLSELAIYGALDASVLPTHISILDSYLEDLATKKSGKRFAKINQINEEISLPSGWRWILLEELLAGSESGWSPKCEAEPRRDNEWGVLKVSAVTWGEFKAEENKRLPLSLEARPECEVKAGDFMLSRANTAELVARSVITPENCPQKLLMSDKIVRLLFLDDRLKPWVNLVNNSEYARAYYKERATGTSDSMRNVSRQVIHELPIPLPPLEVQERIFKSLADLLTICDKLENKAKYRLYLSQNLAAASIAALTGIAIEQEEEPMKAPQTELVAPVRLGTPPDVKAQAPLATILARHSGEMSAKDLWQRFGGGIDAFYAQLKVEVTHGWIVEPEKAEMLEKIEE